MPLKTYPSPPATAEPYHIPQLSGELLNLVGSKSAIRILASAAQTNDTISVFAMDGVAADPPGFHYHKEAHDIFLVTRGEMQVWAGDKARTLRALDFASVPPNIIHRPKLIAPYTQTVGLVSPAHWLDFFRQVSEKYEGIHAPEWDQRPLGPSIGQRLAAAGPRDWDVHFAPDHPEAPVTEWTAGDEVLPEGKVAYYLKADTGPRYLLGGLLVRPMILGLQSGGAFEICTLEGSELLGSPFEGGKRSLVFAKAHHVFFVLDGVLLIWVDGEKEASRVYSGETVFMPAGAKFGFGFGSRGVRVLSFAGPGEGIAELVCEAGEKAEGTVLPDPGRERKIDEAKLEKVAQSIGVSF